MRISGVQLCLLGALVATRVEALGIRLADQDPFATARGNAFAATADDPAAIYYNPAGITQLQGNNVSLGLYGIDYRSSYTSPAGLKNSTAERPQLLPQFYYTYTPQEMPLSFGLGVYSPYGLSLEWPETSGFRTLAIEGRITYLTINPVAAWKILPSLTIAAGPTINYADTELRQGLLSGVPGADQLRFSGNDVDLGFNAGIRWQPLEEHAFGVTYRSPTTMKFSGTSQISGATPFDGSSSANARYPFPQNVVGGWSYRPTPAWNLEVNVDWTDWHRLQVVTLNQPGLALGSIPLPFDWRSSFFYEFGATRYFSNGWRVSAGYIYSENSVPDTHFNPLIPDSDRHIFSIGVGKSWKTMRFDAAYQLSYGPTRTVSGSTPSNVGQSGNGDYSFFSNALTASMGFAF